MPEKRRCGALWSARLAPWRRAPGIVAASLAVALATGGLSSTGPTPLTSLQRAAEGHRAPLPPVRPVLGRRGSATTLQSAGVAPPHRRESGLRFAGDPHQASVWADDEHPRQAEDDRAERRRPRKVRRTFRSVCVRLCDGYYFPLSFAVPAARLRRDSEVCTARCGAQGRVFVHPSPGGSVDDMVDLQGRPYSGLSTAFLYRTEYVASCKCQPHPWETAAIERHRGYALALATKNGDADAARELQSVQARLRELARLSDEEAARTLAALAAADQSSGDLTAGEGKTSTRSGAGGSSKPRRDASPAAASSPSGGRDWAGRVFNGMSGY